MQTFLPHADFKRSAAVLDRQRLGKQRVEVVQILRALTDGGGWARHPAVLMWSGHEFTLVEYGIAVCEEWTSRGYRDAQRDVLLEMADRMAPGYSLHRGRVALLPPDWLGLERFHRSHQSNLIRKDPGRYGPLFPGVPDDLPYFWPVRARKVRVKA